MFFGGKTKSLLRGDVLCASEVAENLANTPLTQGEEPRLLQPPDPIPSPSPSLSFE